MQAPSPTDRLACAILTGEKAVDRALTALVEAGFATESISVVWYTPPEPEDAPDQDNTLAPLVGSGAGDSEAEPTEFDEAQVTLRTGVRRFLPIGAGVGALGGILVVWFGGDPATPIVPQVITSIATGGFLGAMLGIVLGLGQWEHGVDLPDDDPADRPLLIAVDVAAQGREPEACAALSASGAASVKVCTREEAEQLLREAAAASANGAV